MKVTDVERLKGYARGEVVELPPFVEGERFFARLKRPSLMGLAAKGKLPNGLLKAAAELFGGGSAGGTSDAGFKGQCEVFEAMAREALAEPSWEALEEIGLELTDAQILAVFNYTQAGSKALEPFRGVPADIEGAGDERGVPGEAERDRWD
ncbi:MAG: esterase [Defluviitaleaceae bacterium]|nr:esterase [Defluviitaleaceae bacterium]